MKLVAVAIPIPIVVTIKYLSSSTYIIDTLGGNEVIG